MPDYIKMNSKSYVKSQSLKQDKNQDQNNKNCSCARFQSYDRAIFGDDVKICSPNTCALSLKCRNSEYQFNQYVLAQQNLYAVMRRYPERFPIISAVYGLGLTPVQQRTYSNIYYRRLGASQAMPVNDNWGGFALTGSEVPYTN